MQVSFGHCFQVVLQACWVVWVFGEGVDSARGVAAIVVCRRNSSCNSSCDAIVCNGRRTIALFLLFQVQ